MNRDDIIKSLENILSSIYQNENSLTHNFASRTLLKFIEDVRDQESQLRLQ